MTRADRLLGLLGGGMVLAALVLLLIGGTGDGGERDGSAAAPGLQLIEPHDGAVVRNLDIVFRSAGELEAKPAGPGVGDYHLHVEIDGMELMPRWADLERIAPGTYRLSPGSPAPGTHTVRLLWSGPDHRPLPETATPPVGFRVAP